MSKQYKQTEEYIDVDDEIQNTAQQTGYAWEEEYKRSWDVLQEDEDGSLKRTVENFQHRMKRKKLFRDTSTIRRGIIRHIFLIIDLSESMMEKDLRPSRLELTLSYAEQFILEYFDQNPISQLASLLLCNPMDNIRVLKNKKNTDTDGEPSLQNSLQMARSTLIHVPAHGSREILIIMGSLTTCDPGDIYETIDSLVNENIRVSVVGLAAEVQICKFMCKKTKGTYGVVLNEAHFKDLLFEIIPPPPVSVAQSKAELVIMGFPCSVTDSSPSLCACHSKPTTNGYICARCNSKICDLPTDCPVCELTLVSSPHLARSYHHLFPIDNFVEVPWNSAFTTHCFSCQIPFPSTMTSSLGTRVAPDTSGRYKCNKCNQHFCIDCDIFVHEVIHNCPGCLATTSSNH
ncbi:TFIIH basal transcription factor complex, subunit SSL1 [Rhizophagus clarus]|uniref:General transcription and DNA repair factor IIH n=1 Tax=Rhizophagus clarus TaxID=94130 RepID=A0A8H3QLK6_9GLOM|nr:TFIIH basal transcription factor complex, subunit SSL1 [Rhizophagus clarus]